MQAHRKMCELLMRTNLSVYIREARKSDVNALCAFNTYSKIMFDTFLIDFNINVFMVMLFVFHKTNLQDRQISKFKLSFSPNSHSVRHIS